MSDTTAKRPTSSVTRTGGGFITPAATEPSVHPLVRATQKPDEDIQKLTDSPAAMQHFLKTSTASALSEKADEKPRICE